MGFFTRIFKKLFGRKQEWQPTVAQMRAALMLRGERIGQSVVSRVGPNGDYSTLASWQEAWDATSGNLVELRASAVVEVCGNISVSHVFDGFESNGIYNATISAKRLTKVAEWMINYANLSYQNAKLQRVIGEILKKAEDVLMEVEEE